MVKSRKPVHDHTVLVFLLIIYRSCSLTFLTLQFPTMVCTIYLGHIKSSDSDTFILYKKLKETFFLHSLIEKRMLYFSVLFDHTFTNILKIKLRSDLFRLHACWL